MERTDKIELLISFLLLIFTMKETGFKVNFIVLILAITTVFIVTLMYILEELIGIDESKEIPAYFNPKTASDVAFSASIFAITYFYSNSLFNTFIKNYCFILKYILPLIISTIVMIPYYGKLMKSVQIHRIVINFSRTDIDVANDIVESDNLLITVNNNTKKDIHFDINVVCPSDIKATIQGNNKGESETKISDIKVESKKLVYKYIYFNYVGDKPGNSQATVKVTCKDAKHHILFDEDKIINIYKIQ